MTNTENPLLLISLRKNYQLRSAQQHRLVCQAITPCFPTHSQKKIKLLSFYLQLRQGPLQIESNEYQKHSFVIRFNNSNPEHQTSLQIIGKKKISVKEGQFICILSYDKYLNVQSLGQSSIESQIAFWQSSQYFCSMPAKKFVQVLREAQILRYKEHQTAFYQGQHITQNESGSGVYIIRTGQFGYYRQIDSKQIQSFHFSQGHIFGALQILASEKVRSMTARCKTQCSIVYHFSEETFRRLLLKYCQIPIRNKQHKLTKYLQNQDFMMVKSKSFSEHGSKTSSSFGITTTNSIFLKSKFDNISKNQQETQLRAFPTIQLEKIRQTTGMSFFKTQKQSEKIQRESLKKTDYFSLKKEGPLKHYPMISQRSNFISSQFKKLNKLFENKNDKVIAQKDGKITQKKENVWKRDVIYSFYRQSFYNKRQPSKLQS